MWTRASYFVYLSLLVAASCSRRICALNFSIGANVNFSCMSNLICLGDAHEYGGGYNGLNAGSLSLVNEGQDEYKRVGVAYFKESVRMRDRTTGQLTSFNATFSFTENTTINETINTYYPGDGFTFVLSANNSHTGSADKKLGFFGADGTNSFKSVVVEFDNYFNQQPPEDDIGWNHVSLDFMNITYVAAKNASDVGVYFYENSTTYAWVEYSTETQQFEVRVSNSPDRPIYPLLNYAVDLFDKVEDYMWVGFSGSTGGFVTQFYIQHWTFESYSTATPKSYSTATPSKLAIILGISVGVPALLVVFGIIVIFIARRRDPHTGKRAWRLWDQASLRNQSHTDGSMLQLAAGMPEEYRFHYKDLSVATAGFSDESKLGQGGFGSVYRGILPKTGAPIAVKRINRESHQGEKEFMAEVSIISQLRHRNLIQLLGWCDERGEYLIVYELMPNRSLDKLLFGPVDIKHTALSWLQRFKILTGTAAALDYLHQGWKQQVVHRDIKASNIMLDPEWNAKLGDFGLARLVDHQKTPSTTLVAGTYGYIAPEAAASGRFTDKTDVFAFGAVALEIACGRKSVALHLPPDEIILVDWVWRHIQEESLLSVVDRRLDDDYDAHWMEVVLRMGLLCSHPNPLDRPTMRHVVQVLAGDAPVPPIPSSKPVAVFISRPNYHGFGPSPMLDNLYSPIPSSHDFGRSAMVDNFDSPSPCMADLNVPNASSSSTSSFDADPARGVESALLQFGHGRLGSLDSVR